MKRKKKLSIILTVIVTIACFLYWQDNGVTVTKYRYRSNKLPPEFADYKILQISDLQSKMFYPNQAPLVKKIKENDPDMIIITGDLVDSNRYNLEHALVLVRQIVPLAPVYYVSGNHEHGKGRYPEVLQALQKEGVHVLDNQWVKLKKGSDSIALMGIEDVRTNHSYKDIIDTMNQEAGDLFKIMLSHRCELMDVYEEKQLDLIFTGHAHGGQIRLPLIGGMFSPNQGFFPKYTEGIHEKGMTSMVVSRGLGNSIFPFRIFNRPELVFLTLEKQEMFEK